MKKILSVLVALVAVAALTAKTKSSPVKTTTLSVNMHCQSCCKEIEGAIAFVKGVKDISFDVKKDQITVKYDTTKLSTVKLKEEFKNIGYPVN